MVKRLFLFLLTMVVWPVFSLAQNQTIDISGNNTSSNYISYDKAFSIAKGKAVDVKMARYCYFSSTITGSGTLNLYAGGERCYLGTEKGASWPNWNNFMGVPSTSAKDLEEQARNYRVFTDIMLNNDNCPHMVIWGIKDNDSWRSSSNPLLYTAGLSKKPAWYAVRSALRHRAIMKERAGISTHCMPTSDVYTYDLSGRRVNPVGLHSGIYIKKGKKIFIQ